MKCTPNVRQKGLTFGGVFFMSKYSNDFKLEVIEYYKKYGGLKRTANYFNIPSDNTVYKWVKQYEEHGVEGLIRNRIKYDGNFKQNVIEYMHNNHLSYTETAIHFNLGNHDIVGKWERIYYEEGPQALYEERRGRNKNMSSKPRKKKLSKEIEEDLIAENQRLRMENAYLKKLQALVQERTKPKQEKK